MATWNRDGVPQSSTDTYGDVTITGSLGIGTTSPEQILHLEGAGDVGLLIRADNNDSGENDNPLIALQQDYSAAGATGTLVNMNIGMVGLAGEIYTSSLANASYVQAQGSTSSGINTGIMQFVTGGNNGQDTDHGAAAGTARLTILTDGKVGIGTATPSTALQVSGTATATTFAGNLTGNVTGSNWTGTLNISGTTTVAANVSSMYSNPGEGVSILAWNQSGDDNSTAVLGLITVSNNADLYCSFIHSMEDDPDERWSLGVDGSSDTFKLSYAALNVAVTPSSSASYDLLNITKAGVVTTAGTVNGASATEMGYLSGVSSAIQTQLNSKQATLTYGRSAGNALKISAAAQPSDGDLLIANGTDVSGRAIGIANDNIVEIDDADAANNDYAKFTANGLSGRSYAEVLSDIGAQATLTFGIANNNAVDIDAADVAEDDYAQFTADGLQGRSATEVKTDLSLSNVTNHAQLPLAGGTMTGDINMGANAVGFTQFEPTYNASDTEVHFDDNGNKAFATFGAGNITDLNLYFPDFSCNCVLLLKQDGSGSRTVTNFKTFDQADGNESTVQFAGGSNPTLTTAANKIDIISLYWDNDNHKAYGTITKNF